MNFQNPKFVLVAIGLLFFTPLLLAILMRSDWWDFRPDSLSNRGQLVQPPVSLEGMGGRVQYTRQTDSLGVARQWVVLFPFPANCERECQKSVIGLRQIHLAAGRNRNKLAIWLLSPRQVNSEVLSKLLAIYTEIDIRIDENQKIFELLARIQGASDLQYGQAFLLDPAANIILRYQPGFDPNDINKDLDRLLAWSGKD